MRPMRQCMKNKGTRHMSSFTTIYDKNNKKSTQMTKATALNFQFLCHQILI